MSRSPPSVWLATMRYRAMRPPPDASVDPGQVVGLGGPEAGLGGVEPEVAGLVRAAGVQVDEPLGVGGGDRADLQLERRPHRPSRVDADIPDLRDGRGTALCPR